jgi:hypothetical protein
MVTQSRAPSSGQRGLTIPSVRPRTAQSKARWIPSRMLLGLVAVLSGLSFAASSVGLLWGGGSGSSEFVAVTGETVELYGRGLYANDSLFKAGANQGADVLTLAFGIPLLLVAARLYLRGSLRGHLLLLGTSVWFLYYYASMSLGTAYNGLFLLYVGLFAASLYAVIFTFIELQARRLDDRVQPDMPRRALAIFMFASGLITTGIWLIDPLSALIGGASPAQLEHGATLVTTALDIAVIVPATFIAGVLILRHVAFGYAVAMSLLVLEILLLPMIALQTIFQLRAGVSFTTVEIVGPIGGFSVLAAIAIWMTVNLLRNIDEHERALNAG